MYKLFSSYVCFTKLLLFFKVNKLAILDVNLITLNKVKLNYIILLIILLSIIHIRKNCYISMFIVFNVLFLKLKFIYFLNLFFYGLFKIHPILFYLSLVFYSHIIANNFSYLKVRIITIVTTSVASLFLGGIWALYQLNWGYYWSNDPIEFALLFIICLYVYKLHTLKINSRFKNILLLYILFYIYLIRSNLIYTKHNFFNIYNYLYVYIKVISYFFFINLLSFSVEKLTVLKFNSTYMYLLLIIIPLVFNLTFNTIFKKFIISYTTFTLLYYFLQLNWDDLHIINIHILVFSFLLIFMLYRLQYIIFFTFKDKHYKNVNINIFFKKYVKFDTKYKSYVDQIYKPNIHKLTNWFKIKKVNFFLLKKKLINYYI